VNLKKRCSCPLCNSEAISFLGDIAYVQPVLFSTSKVELNLTPQLWKCRSCLSWFTQNIFNQEDAEKLYSQGAAGERWSRVPFNEQKHRSILEVLKGISGDGVELLDVGCNTGELLDFVKEQGCETSGVEFSSSSRDVLRSKGHTAYASMEALTKLEKKFDVITAFDLIEHLYDVPKFITMCTDLLNDGGVLIIMTGDQSSLSARFCGEKWWYLKYPEHIVFPSRSYFESLSGLELINWLPTYASLSYDYPFLVRFRAIAASILKKVYVGLPSIGSDHALIVLRK